MASQTPDSADPTLTARQLHSAVRRLTESDEALKGHRQFISKGGKIHWIVDTDVVIHYLQPMQKARYAEIFPQLKVASEPSAGLIALSTLLADFIFSDRFQVSVDTRDGLNVRPKKLLLAPHADEFHEVVAAIARAAGPLVASAKEATDGGLSRQVMDLLNSFTKGNLGDLSQEAFVSKLQQLIADSYKFILPNGPLDELRRASDLLRGREALIYQADNEDIEAMLSGKNIQERLDAFTDTWTAQFKEIHHSSNFDESDKAVAKRQSQRVIANYRDARVLATLEILNDLGVKSDERYVLISGQDTLQLIVKPRGGARQKNVHIIHPRAFLGNPRLLESKEMPTEGAKNGEHPDRWKRITDAVSFLSNLNEAELEGHTDLVHKLLHEWRVLERMAIPFLPEQAQIPNVRALAKDIFRGQPLDALETQLYIALSDFFALSAELNLAGHLEPLQGAMKRKPPPLRLAFYPEAEAFIVKIINRGLWNSEGEADTNAIAAHIERVKDEQQKEARAAALQSFNYPLLLCFAERFAAMGEWHACRLLAAHAKAVASATRESLPYITGRDAALLEGYARRLDARRIDDLGGARDALRYFRSSCQKEQEAWSDPEKRMPHEVRCALHSFNPENEFAIHALRADVEELMIDFSELMFELFTADQVNVMTALQSRVNRFSALSSRVNGSLASLRALAVFHGPPKSPRALLSIRDYLQIQLEICGLQCGLFLFAAKVDGKGYEVWKAADLLERVNSHKTEVATLIAAVARGVWGEAEQRSTHIEVIRRICDDQKKSNIKSSPFDLPRGTFLLHLVEKVAKLGAY